MKGQRLNEAQIEGGNGGRVIEEECAPGLGWRSSAPHHVLGHRRFGDFEPKLQQLTMNSWSARQWVLLAHSSDEIAEFTLDSGSPCPTARFPTPIDPTALPVPAQDGIRLNNSS